MLLFTAMPVSAAGDSIASGTYTVSAGATVQTGTMAFQNDGTESIKIIYDADANTVTITDPVPQAGKVTVTKTAAAQNGVLIR